MQMMAVAALVAILATGCSGTDRSSWPTAPSAAEPARTAGPNVRVEPWRLALTIRVVLGIDCRDGALEGTREVDLWVEYAEDGTVAMRYSQPARPATELAVVTGWMLDGGFEGAGTAYEGLPCSGAPFEPGGAPTTLTGYFSEDGRTFTGVEVRRYMARPEGDLVYHVEWNASKVEN
jgi:hypothetical protein